jgi:very-short-patch-repair endonuclease
MSLTHKSEIRLVAKKLYRELRKNQTKAEKILWEHLRGRKLNYKKFYRQHPLFHDVLGKETFYIVDFFCFESKLVIELDGGIHIKRKEEDNLRDEIINLLGIKVVRFKNEDVLNNLENVLAVIFKNL